MDTAKRNQNKYCYIVETIICFAVLVFLISKSDFSHEITFQYIKNQYTNENSSVFASIVYYLFIGFLFEIVFGSVLTLIGMITYSLTNKTVYKQPSSRTPFMKKFGLYHTDGRKFDDFDLGFAFRISSIITIIILLFFSFGII